MTMPIRAILVGENSFASLGLFNANAFPPQVRNPAMGCADELALLENSYTGVISKIELNKSRFLEKLKTERAFVGFVPQPEKPIVVLYHELSFLSDLIAFFVFLKGFLDQYARLVTKLIDEKSALHGFHKKKVRERKIAGWALVNWLRNRPRHHDVLCHDLADLFERHIRIWVNDAISLRDHLVHYPYFLPDLGALVTLDRPIIDLDLQSIASPRMPLTNVDVPLYLKRTRTNLYALMQDTLPRLPHVDFLLISHCALSFLDPRLG